jgi:hypothetical protein
MTPQSSPLRRVLERLGLAVPPERRSLAGLRPGPVHLVGVLECGEPLTSPIAGTACACYRYSARATGSGRADSGARARRLLTATVYGGALALTLDDGRLALVPPRSDSFGPEAHAALEARDYGGFRARERLLLPGTEVRVLGVARDEGGAWQVQVKQLAAAGAVRAAPGEQPAGDDD